MTQIATHRRTEVQSHRYRWLLTPLTAFLVARIAIFGIVLLADTILPGFNDIHVFNSGSVGADFVNAWDRWDSVWYVDVAENGYSYIPGYDRNTVAFFPLYPVAIAALAPLTGSALLAGLVISNASFLAALIVLYQLVLLKTGDETVSRKTVFYIALFPAAFFFAAAYSESLFLLLSVVTASLLLRRQWLWAGVAGAFASATRPTGILLVILFGFAWLEAHGWLLSRVRQRASWQNLGTALRRDWMTLLPILLIPLGLLAFMGYLGIRFENPFAVFQSHSGWRQASGLQAFLNDIQLLLTGRLWVSYIMDMAVFFIVIACIIPIGRKFGAGYALYTAASVLIPASTGVMSMTRISTVLFPVFMLLATWVRSERINRILQVVFLVLLTLFTLAFVKNVFLG